MNKTVEDRLIIGVDFSDNDEDVLRVIKIKGNDVYIVNQFKNEEAVEIYNKLIGKPYSICYKCIHHECAWKGDNVKSCKYFEKDK